MMKTRQRAAIELLMHHPDCVVAEMLGVRMETLRQWMQVPDFVEALRTREREQVMSAVRLARQALVNAASALCALTTEPGKCDPKVLIEVVKVGKVFETEPEDPGTALAEVIRRAVSVEGSETRE